MSEAQRPGGLDPDQAAELARRRRAGEDPAPRLPRQPIDTRRYQRMIGGFGLLLVLVFSVYITTSGHSSSPGIAAGRQIHRFVAPLATSDLNAAANAHPRCDPARPARHGLNVCGRGPLVLGFFVTGAASCVRAVDALQSVSSRFPQIQFAAVAVNASRRTTVKLVRRHHWTIPVAYDLTGAVGQVYGVEVCPIIELVRPGGRVEQRLIGQNWTRPGDLEPRVAQLAARLSGG